MPSVPYEPGSLARGKRPPNVRATDSAAPEEYSPLPSTPDEGIFTHRSHSAQYGAGRRYGIGIRALILHTTQGTHFFNSINYDMWRPETVSASAFAGPGGELAYCIADQDRPWTTGRWNDESLTLEVVGRAEWTAAEWRARTPQLEAITRWIVSCCRRHSIPPTWLDALRFAEGASKAGQSPLRAGTRRGITDHRTANDAAISLGHDPVKYSHWDIGPGLRTVVFEDIIPEAAKRLGLKPEGPQVMDFNLISGGSTLLIPDQAPVRIADSRIGLGYKQGLVGPGAVRVPIPKGTRAKSAVLNVTIVDPVSAGYFRVRGNQAGDGSNGNFVVGQPPTPSSMLAQVVEGMVTVELVRGTAHVLVDLMGIIE